MTAKNATKMMKQLEGKPAKLEKFKKHNLPMKRTFGRGSKKCKICGRRGAHVSKYGLNLCRQTFRDIAEKIGFTRYS